MTNPFEYEKEIDAIRAKLYQEMQELGKEEFDRRQSAKVREAAKKYGFTIVPSASTPRPAP